MVTFAIIVTQVVGCHGYVKAPRVLVAYVFCLCHLSISTHIDIKGKWLKQGVVYTRVLDAPFTMFSFRENTYSKCVYLSAHS